jgi:hypothetical protein
MLVTDAPPLSFPLADLEGEETALFRLTLGVRWMSVFRPSGETERTSIQVPVRVCLGHAPKDDLHRFA